MFSKRSIRWRGFPPDGWFIPCIAGLKWVKQISSTDNWELSSMFFIQKVCRHRPFIDLFSLGIDDTFADSSPLLPLGPSSVIAVCFCWLFPINFSSSYLVIPNLVPLVLSVCYDYQLMLLAIFHIISRENAVILP